MPTIEGTLTPTREVHVATDGDDGSGGDGSATRPYATLSRALGDVAPGTALRVHAGTYAGGIWISDVVAGTADAPVWIGGVPGEARPVIQGGTEGLHLSRVRYLILHDLVVAGATHNGINCDDGGTYADPLAAHHVLFRGLEIRDIGTGGNHDGLKLSGLNHYAIVDCTFLRVSAGSGIDHVGCHHGLIARCRFEGMGSNAVQCKGGTEDLEIRRCDFTDAGERGINIGGSTGFEYFRPPLSTTVANAEARDVRVIANVFGNAVTPFAFVGAVDCLVAHNTFRGDAYRWLFRVLQETTTSGDYTFAETRDCRLIGNVFHFSRAALSTYVNVGPSTRGDTYTIARQPLVRERSPVGVAADRPPRTGEQRHLRRGSVSGCRSGAAHHRREPGGGRGYGTRRNRRRSRRQLLPRSPRRRRVRDSVGHQRAGRRHSPSVEVGWAPM